MKFSQFLSIEWAPESLQHRFKSPMYTYLPIYTYICLPYVSSHSMITGSGALSFSICYGPSIASPFPHPPIESLFFPYPALHYTSIFFLVLFPMAIYHRSNMVISLLVVTCPNHLSLEFKTLSCKLICFNSSLVLSFFTPSLHVFSTICLRDFISPP